MRTHAASRYLQLSIDVCRLCSDTWIAYFELIGCTTCMSELEAVRGPMNVICKTADSLAECTSSERTKEARTEICGGDPECSNLSPESGEPSLCLLHKNQPQQTPHSCG